jgi:NTE family protein
MSRLEQNKPLTGPEPSLGRAGPHAGSGAHRRHISLALQGGGAHGAFTWGVLDRLLEDQEIAIEGDIVLV